MRLNFEQNKDKYTRLAVLIAIFLGIAIGPGWLLALLFVVAIALELL